MPIYDYLCTACDHRADILHGINDPGPNFCLSCGAEGTMRKQFAAPAIHFKGSGWAKKDRGATSSTRAAAKSSTGDANEGKPAEGKAAEGKPAEGSSAGSPSSAASDTPKPSTTD
jgi:putative FmdB family regulatory protein